MKVKTVFDEPEPVIKIKKRNSKVDRIEKLVLDLIKKYGGETKISNIEKHFGFDVCDVLIELVKKGVIEVI